MEKVGLLDRAIAPLHWLERSRGWKRVGLVALYLLIALVVGVFGWRELSLWRLPNMGEPFDTVKYGTISVADANNSMVVYREAALRLIVPGLRNYAVASQTAWDSTDWSAIDPEVHRWVVDNRAGFDVWVRGTERPDSLLIQPKDLEISSDMAVLQSLRDYSRIALFEASRLEFAGDPEGAWKMYRCILRASRHAGQHGGFVPRLIGQAILRKARPSIQLWISHPKVTPSMLRKALGDLEECMSMTSPISEMVRAEYFGWRSILKQPENWKKAGLEPSDDDGIWYYQFGFVRPTEKFFLHEPERSLRVLRLITAGILAQCDRPPSSRPKIYSGVCMIYDIDAQTPPAVASISPAELVSWAKASSLRYMDTQTSQMFARMDAERGIFDKLRIDMAERAYEIEHGKLPVTYRDLVGSYLRELPEGFEPGDVISAASDPK